MSDAGVAEEERLRVRDRKAGKKEVRDRHTDKLTDRQ